MRGLAASPFTFCSPPGGNAHVQSQSHRGFGVHSGTHSVGTRRNACAALPPREVGQSGVGARARPHDHSDVILQLVFLFIEQVGPTRSRFCLWHNGLHFLF